MQLTGAGMPSSVPVSTTQGGDDDLDHEDEACHACETDTRDQVLAIRQDEPERHNHAHEHG